MDKRDILRDPIEHIDIKAFDSTPIVDGMRKMSFTARETARAADIFNRMLGDKECTVILCIAGSTSAGGCMQVYIDMVRHNRVDAIVATGATVVDMDFFESLGSRHYRGSPVADDKRLRELYIDRIYDTLIDEEQLQACDNTIKKIADDMEKRPYSSREFIRAMDKYLKTDGKKEDSLVLGCVRAGCAYLLSDLFRFQRRLRPRVDTTCEQMVFAEATCVLPLIASCAYHKRLWQDRPQRRWSRIFEPAFAGEHA